VNTNALAVAVAAKAAGISGMRGASPLLPDTIPASPWSIVGAHSATFEMDSANRSRVRYTFPIRCYVERTNDAARTASLVNDLVDAFVLAYSTGLTYGATVAEGRITGWNTDLFAEVGSALYQVIELTLFVLVFDTTAHTP